MTDPDPKAAGPFSAWLAAMRAALDGRGAADVPCDGCTACCTSSQFVHIGPDEADTLAHVPAGLLFPAPGLPDGHVVLGYDERGHCPMLVGGRCSIYAHRPRACRTYDCRVFPAAGVTPEDEPAVARQAGRGRFEHPGDDDRDRHAAVRAATRFLRSHGSALPGGGPRTATQLAVLAVEVHDAFLGRDEDPEPGAVAVAVRAARGGGGRP